MKTTQPTTSEQMVLGKLRRSILEGDLPIGEFLSQRKLAEQTGASVISVRGALRQLENDGLMENIPRWGVRIPMETEEMVKDRYRIRELLEVYAVESIYGNLTEHQKNSLLEQAAELDLLAEDESKEAAMKFAHLNHNFHLYLAECCGSPLLAKLLERVANMSLMVLNAKSTWSSKDKQAACHADLVNTIINASLHDAVEAMRIHVQNGLSSELAGIENRNQATGES